MGRVSPAAHLSVLVGVLVTDFAALLSLRCQPIRLGSNSGLLCQLQTWIIILKCALDSALVSLLALDTAKGNFGGEQRLVQTSRMLLRLMDSFRTTIWAYC